MKNKLTFGILALFTLAIFIVACEPKVVDKKVVDTKITELESSQDLKKFENEEEIIQFLQSAASGGERYYGGSGMVRTMGIETMAMDMAVAESAGAPAAAPSAKVSGGADDYSETNIQVKGVDEADFVKNDGKYIYVLTQNKLVIVDAFPADDAEILSETKIDGNPRNIFVNKDRLVVFSQENEQIFTIQKYDFIPRPRYTQKTHVYVYDISDREDPELVSDFNLLGNYFESRMIDEHVYFIVQDNVFYQIDYINMPVIKESSATIVRPEVFYFDNPEQNYVFHTIASFDIFDGEDINAKSFMMGHSNNLFVSKDNIYITYQKNLPYRYHQEHQEDRFFEVVVPLFPSNVRAKINDVKNLDSYERWNEISEILEDMYNNMEERDKQDLVEEIFEAIEEYEIKLEKERRKTVIHKINIDDGEIDYDTKGEVQGYLLNQFSMDENDGYFRVATTVNIWSGREPILYNNVYVLDDELEQVGKIEGIAPDERIFSTRFIQDRLYMVTFKRIDPLFVIDLSNPTDPKILGELKIPGFSDYLHPYDENHIIGIGKETKSNEWGGVSTRGVKLSLFDVSDVENPKQIDKYEIGDQGTDSEALREHKAFLFDKEKNLLVIPVREVKGNRYYDGRYGYYRQRIWQGAYVFGLTPEDGFEVKGKVTHNELDEDYRYYWGSPNAVRRSLYMDDVLYTVSSAKIKMNDLDDIDEINEIDLPYEDPRYYPGPYPMPMRGIAEEAVAVSPGLPVAVEELE